MRRLIVIAPTLVSPADAARDGATAALHEALATRDGIWVGRADDVALPQTLVRGVTLAAAGAGDEALADAVAALARPDDLLWVVDAAAAGVGAALRRRGLGNRLALQLGGAPADADALRAYDLIAFPSAEARDGHLRATLAAGEEPGEAIVAPRGIDVAHVEADAASEAAQRTRERLWMSGTGRALIVGVDALDPASGLTERMAGYRRFLERHADLRGLISLLQVALPGTAEPRLGESLHLEAGRVNAAYGDLDWTPLRLVPRAFDPATLAGVCRAARVGLVTPVADGMAERAKAFVAAQDPRDPAALVLSDHPGAVAQLPGALPVDPRDADAIATALARAIAMGRDERVQRWEDMIHALRREDAAWWRDTVIAALDR